MWVNNTYLLTPWNRVLLEKLTGSTASQEIPRIFGTRRFLTVFTSARHMSLSWTNSIQSLQPLRTSWRSILTLSSHLHGGKTKFCCSVGFEYNNHELLQRDTSNLFYGVASHTHTLLGVIIFVNSTWNIARVQHFDLTFDTLKLLWICTSVTSQNWNHVPQ